MRQITGAPRETAAAMLGQMESLEAKLKGIRTVTEQETEQRLRRQLATEIGQSALPQVLPDYPSRENFSVAGIVEPGAAPSCTFYDYFYIDPGLLCIVIGQTPAAAWRRPSTWWWPRPPSAADCGRGSPCRRRWRM